MLSHDIEICPTTTISFPYDIVDDYGDLVKVLSPKSMIWPPNAFAKGTLVLTERRTNQSENWTDGLFDPNGNIDLDRTFQNDDATENTIPTSSARAKDSSEPTGEAEYNLSQGAKFSTGIDRLFN